MCVFCLCVLFDLCDLLTVDATAVALAVSDGVGVVDGWEGCADSDESGGSRGVGNGGVGAIDRGMGGVVVLVFCVIVVCAWPLDERMGAVAGVVVFFRREPVATDHDDDDVDGDELLLDDLEDCC